MLKFAFQSIMIVDDSEIDSWLAETLICRIGLADSILTFKTATSALDYLAEINTTRGTLKWPDLIFLDLVMPIHDGFDFLTKYEAMKQHDIAVCILTASILSADREKAMRFKSVKGFVIKPLVQNVLIELKRAKQQTDHAQ